MDGRTLLVTGGAGFIGSAFVRGALAAGAARVIVLDKLTYAGNLENLAAVAGDPRLVFERGDIADGPRVAALLAAHRPDAVLNFAAESHVDASIAAPEAFLASNVAGVFHLLEAVRAHHAGLLGAERDTFRFLQVSTDEVYGSIPAPGRFHEESPLAPASPYAATKAGGDALVHAWFTTFGVPTLLTRGSNTYGPHQLPEKLIPLLVRNALAGLPLPIYGDGLNVRDWMHVDDHCDGITTVLARGAPGRVYNLGGGEERTNLAIVDGVCAALDALAPAARPRRELLTFVEDRRGHDRRYALDTTRVRTELGWAPARSLDTGLPDTVRWYVDHPGWCAHVATGEHRAYADLAALGAALGARP